MTILALKIKVLKFLGIQPMIRDLPLANGVSGGPLMVKCQWNKFSSSGCAKYIKVGSLNSAASFINRLTAGLRLLYNLGAAILTVA